MARGPKGNGKREHDFPCLIRIMFTLFVTLYGVYLLYCIYTNQPLQPQISQVYATWQMKTFIAVAVVLMLLQGDLLQAVLVASVYALTYVVDSFSSSNQAAQPEARAEEATKENMTDLPQYGDSPIGKAYNPRENYIGGIYDFTGHLAFEQVEVVPP